MSERHYILSKVNNPERGLLTELMTAAILENQGIEPKTISAFRKAFDELHDAGLWAALIPEEAVKNYVRRLFIQVKPGCIKKTTVRRHQRTVGEKSSSGGEQQQTGGPRLSPEESRERTQRAAREQLYARSQLARFIVNGQPVGELLVEEVERAAIRSERGGRFLRLLCQGVPAGGRIRDYVTPDEADRKMTIAELAGIDVTGAKLAAD